MEEEAHWIELDVGGMISSGVQPFPVIMERVRALGRGERLRLHVPFDPLPLRSVLLSEGFAVDVRESDSGAVVVEIRREEGARDTGGMILDLRDVGEDEAMARVLEAASLLGRREELVAHLKFLPAPLLDELRSRPYEVECEEAVADGRVVRIWRRLFIMGKTKLSPGN